MLQELVDLKFIGPAMIGDRGIQFLDLDKVMKIDFVGKPFFRFFLRYMGKCRMARRLVEDGQGADIIFGMNSRKQVEFKNGKPVSGAGYEIIQFLFAHRFGAMEGAGM